MNKLSKLKIYYIIFLYSYVFSLSFQVLEAQVISYQLDFGMFTLEVWSLQ